jgi:hypothetical protein
MVVKQLHGGGLPLFECLALRVQDVNFEMKVLTVHDGTCSSLGNLVQCFPLLP